MEWKLAPLHRYFRRSRVDSSVLLDTGYINTAVWQIFRNKSLRTLIARSGRRTLSAHRHYYNPPWVLAPAFRSSHPSPQTSQFFFYIRFPYLPLSSTKPTCAWDPLKQSFSLPPLTYSSNFWALIKYIMFSPFGNSFRSTFLRLLLLLDKPFFQYWTTNPPHQLSFKQQPL